MIDLHTLSDLSLLRESVDLQCKLAAGRDVLKVGKEHFGTKMALSRHQVNIGDPACSFDFYSCSSATMILATCKNDLQVHLEAGLEAALREFLIVRIEKDREACRPGLHLHASRHSATLRKFRRVRIDHFNLDAIIAVETNTFPEPRYA